MTTLQRIVRRECGRATDGGRPIIVSLEPGDVIGFRLKGCRRTYRTTVQACYSLAVKLQLADERREKRRRTRP
uniref:Uncharacterized protein n=1 Tax=viral metagenome TaxID=1070528 RepID=A0A6M3JN01_9ZZZZ